MPGSVTLMNKIGCSCVSRGRLVAFELGMRDCGPRIAHNHNVDGAISADGFITFTWKRLDEVIAGVRRLGKCVSTVTPTCYVTDHSAGLPLILDCAHLIEYNIRQPITLLGTCETF